MLLTDDPNVYQRVQMYQDVVGGIRNQIPADQILPGINFRMPELLGAVALVQLGRLESLLADMRHRKQVIKESLADVALRKGIQFRVQNDPQGEAAIALIFFVPETRQAKPVSEALQAEGVDNFVMYSPDEVDYHVYAHWAPILNQRSWSTRGGPWRNHPRKIVYATDMCPRTLEWLNRAIHIDISPELDTLAVEEISEGINKVLEEVI
jgi:dTDP-4-amino-4,6-dideoxygalactose transaminase